MNLDWKKIVIGICILLAVVGILIFILSLLRRSQAPANQGTGPNFGTAGNITTPIGGGTGASGNLPVFSSSGSSTSPINTVFKITDGPVVSGMLLQSGLPTTTVARYVTAEDGHVLDLPVDTPGATAHIVSNTTIPGIQTALWSEKGAGILLQYLDQGALKTVHLGFASSTGSTTLSAVSIHFLPDNAAGLAVSPDTKSITYLLRTQNGIDGYVAKADTSNAKKLYSILLHEVTVSWPSQNTILVYSKSASGAPGIAFSVSVKTGAVSSLLYGVGLSALSNQTFSHLLYRTDDGLNATLFSENIAQGSTTALIFSSTLKAPLPEQCLFSNASSTLAYCAAPISLPLNYLDLWHQGASSIANALVMIAAKEGSTTPLVTPGTNGGEPSDMINLSLSPDEHYLSFVNKDDGSLWGVRLK